MLHVSINNAHVSIIMLHVDIIYLACRGQKKFFYPVDIIYFACREQKKFFYPPCKFVVLDLQPLQRRTMFYKVPLQLQLK